MNSNNQKYLEYLRSAKWKEIARKRLEIDGFRCCMCGSEGTASNPLECHHLSYKWLYHEESRIFQDLLTLCHVCHKSTHRMMSRVTDPSGRRGWSDRNDIPHISVCSLDGTEFESYEVDNE